MKHYETVKKIIAGKAELCVVTKRHSVEEIMPFYEAGERIFGENHVQDLTAKAQIMPADIQWQMIGHLQTNKVRQLAPYAARIQSLDSLKLAKEINKECAKINKVMPCFAEFHLALEDENKTGLAAADAVDFIKACQEFPNVKIEGIMAMGPHTEDEEEIRRIFEQGHELFLSLQKEFGADQIKYLSMGMSDDYPIAVDCGSNMVRIGTYLFTEDGE
ncbi:MAG: YggS family pyridoxal phosphate-dependent enzyme [Solobacterium sp.]|nr:YggS family pyridoxal phosphate-dependent enzyme [Solobacterium sp.]